MRIDAQAAAVALLEPGSEPHRLATTILLMLTDCLFIEAQIAELVAIDRRMRDRVPD